MTSVAARSRVAYAGAMRASPAPQDTSKAIMIIVFVMAMFAGQDALTKYLAQSYSATQIVWVRYIFFAAFAVSLARARGGIRNRLRSSRPVLQIFRSLLIAAEIGLFVIIVRILPLADVHALMASFPLIVTALSALLLKEQVGIRRWSAVAIGFLGVLVIIRPGFEEIQTSMLLVLLAAVMFAVYNVITKIVSRDDDSETSLLYMGIVGAVVMTFVGPFQWQSPTAIDWVWLMVLGLSATMGHLLLITALELAPASVLQPYNYLLLVFATIVGFLVFGHVPDLLTIVGATIVVGSGLYVFYRERQRAAAEKRTLPAAGKSDTSIG